MKNILIFSTAPSSEMGGISTAVNLLTTELKKQGLSTTNITTHSPKNGKIKNTFLFISAILSLFFTRYNEITNKLPASTVYVHVGPKGSLIRKLILLHLAKTLGSKVYSHYHSATFENYLHSDGFWKKALLSICKKSDKNIVLSNWWFNVFSNYKVTNLAIVPNFVEAAPDIKERKQSHSTEKTIFSISRLVQEKNIQLVIEAIALLPTNYSLKIAGDGPYRSELEKLSHDLDIGHRIEFIGWVNKEQKSTLYLNSDVLAVPSSHDSFGLVFIEALSFGCPVVIGPNPAVKAALNELPGVYEAQKYTAQEIADSIITATTSNLQRKILSSACQEKYSADAISIVLKNTIFSDE
ncbi:glycosyltransferase [Pseudomonas sp. GM49]|uniref:glycosyltransferase family 4 protein n=1 Tax=Pseudomonas sp. GM49 TaxID=1144331 RepID=UPI00026FF5A9|nr:glycosyltransferase family 4 protein [Pseudomonas sp. GM49]EJM61950.1 glycosyltransferase [Pseudomonas sp. GM49]